jgi:hypothetical protein
VVPVLASFRDRGLSSPELLPAFVLGIACLTVVLAWLCDGSGGSVLIAALFHGTYNMVAGTAAAEGAIGTIVTIAIMLAAAALVLRAAMGQRAGLPPMALVRPGDGSEW